MQIQWFGQSYFRLQTKNNNDEVVIAIDPFGDEYGLKPVKFKADVAIVSHEDVGHNNLNSIIGEPFVINNPGEYETKGVFVYGVPSWHDNKEGKEKGANIIYRIQIEDMSIVHLGDLGSDLTDEDLEKIGNVDILMIPVGGASTIDAKKANEIVGQIEPRIVIPMHYHLPELKFKSGKKLAPVDDFLKICGFPTEKLEKLKISKKDLMPEGGKVVLLEKLSKA